MLQALLKRGEINGTEDADAAGFWSFRQPGIDLNSTLKQAVPIPGDDAKPLDSPD